MTTSIRVGPSAARESANALLNSSALVTDTAYLLLGVTARERLGSAAARHVNQVAGVILIAAALWLALQHEA